MKDSFIDKIHERDPRVRDDAEKTERARSTRDQMRDLFARQNLPKIKEIEKEKSPEDILICGLVSEQLNKVRAKYGQAKFVLPEKNVHLIKPDKWDTLPDVVKEGFSATTDIVTQSMLVRDTRIRSVKAHRIFHDGEHLMSYNTVQHIPDPEKNHSSMVRLRQSGLARWQDRAFLYPLREGVAEELWVRNMHELLAHPIFAKEVARTNEVRAQFPDAEVDGRRIFDDPTVYFADTMPKKVGKKMFSIDASGRTTTNFAPDIVHYGAAYEDQRHIVNTLLDKIFSRNASVYADREEVFDLFGRAEIGGDLAPVWQAVDTTFGNGTLNKIAELGNDVGAIKDFVESL